MTNKLRLRILILITFILWNINLFSKNNSLPHWLVKLNSTQLIDITTFPTLQLSAEKRFTKLFSLNCEFGYQLYNLVNVDTLHVTPNGFKASIEGRIYYHSILKPNRVKRKNDLFFGIQFFYRKNERTNSLLYRLDGSLEEEIDCFNTRTIGKGINTILGNQYLARRCCIIEPYIGMGFILRKVSNSYREFQYKTHSINGTDMGPYFAGLNLKESSGMNVNFTFGIRFAYIIK